MAIAQRLDILVEIPPGEAFPIFAQVEGKKDRTGIVLAAPGATIGKLAGLADAAAPAVDLSLEERLVGNQPAGRTPGRQDARAGADRVDVSLCVVAQQRGLAERHPAGR